VYGVLQTVAVLACGSLLLLSRSLPAQYMSVVRYVTLTAFVPNGMRMSFSLLTNFMLPTLFPYFVLSSYYRHARGSWNQVGESRLFHKWLHWMIF
jgi:hypothetical protein